MNSTEIERKRIIKPGRIETITNTLKEVGFAEKSVLREVDTYYTRRDIDFMETVECLRVRERDGFAEITYKPASNSTTNNGNGIIAKKESNAILKDNTQALIANELLETIGLIKLVSVDKTRKSFKSNNPNVTIAIDTIVNAGTFIEVEVMSDDIEKATQELEAIEEMLGINDYDIASLPYRDMVMNGIKK